MINAMARFLFRARFSNLSKRLNLVAKENAMAITPWRLTWQLPTQQFFQQKFSTMLKHWHNS